MKIVKNWILAFIFTASIGGALLATLPTTANAAAVDCTGKGLFLTFPAWYRGLATVNSDNSGCDITGPSADKGGLSLTAFIWTIVLNCLDIGLQLVVYISSFFILFGGFQFITSSGESAGIVKAKSTVTNAVIGLVISLVAVGVVNLIFGLIK
jgi:hypothetical protein